MVRKTLESKSVRLSSGLTALASHVTLQTPDLGSWDMFEWEVREQNGRNFTLIGHGSMPHGQSFILFEDVFDHLHFKFVRELELEPAFACDSPSDADPGL